MKQALVKSLARALACGPWTSEHLGPPRSGAWDVAEDAKRGILHVARLEEAPPSIPKEAPIAAPLLKGTLRDSLIGDLKALEVITLRNGRYFQPHLALIDADDRVLHDYTYLWLNEAHCGSRVFEMLRLGPTVSLPGKTLLLDGPSHNSNYFHWLVETLPRIVHVQEAGHPLESFDHIVVSGARPNFVLETLRRAGVDEAKLISPEKIGRHLSFDQLVAVSNSREHLYESSRKAVRRLVPSSIDDSSPKRIFISRDDAPTRRLQNEREIMTKLAHLDFTRVVLSGLTVADQAALFSNADVIVAPHGAALANLLFCRPETTLLELHYPHYTKGLYWRLADSLGMKYAAILGDRPLAQGLSSDMTVDPADIMAMLEQLGIAKPPSRGAAHQSYTDPAPV